MKKRKLAEIMMFSIIGGIVIGFGVFALIGVIIGWDNRMITQVNLTMFQIVFFLLTITIFSETLIVKWQTDPKHFKEIISKAIQNSESYISRKIVFFIFWTINYVISLSIFIIANIQNIIVNLNISYTTAFYIAVVGVLYFGHIIDDWLIEKEVS